MTEPPGKELREIRVDAAPQGCPVCAFSTEDDQRAVLRPADPHGVEDGIPFTANLVGDRESTRMALSAMQEAPRFQGLEVVNLSPYCMVVKAVERSGEEVGSSLLWAVYDRFGRDAIVDPFLVEDGVARLRALVTRPISTREALQELQAMQEEAPWETFQVHGVSAFDPRDHVGLLRQLLPPGQESLLRLAVDMGYYETPKKCTLEEIGERVGLSASPVHKRLKESEERLVKAFLEPESVPHPPVEGEAPEWVQDVTRETGPMVEILARYQWEEAELHDYMEAYPEARIVLHPFYDDPHTEGVAFLAVAVGGEPEAFAQGAREAPHLRDVEVVREGEDHSVIRVEATEGRGSRGPTPMLRVSRRLGREAFLNPAFAEGGDVWLSLVTARHLTYEDVHGEFEAVGEEVGWDDWDLVSIRPLEGRRTSAGTGTDGLTDRQREVLDIARALGYYETPRESTLADIARTLGVSENAVHKNLTAAERKIVRTYLRSGV